MGPSCRTHHSMLGLAAACASAYRCLTKKPSKNGGFKSVQPPCDLFLSISILVFPGCLCPSTDSQCPGSHSEGSLFCDYRLFPLPPTFTRECNRSDWHYTRLSQLLSFPNCYMGLSSCHHPLLLPEILQLENSDNL